MKTKKVALEIDVPDSHYCFEFKNAGGIGKIACEYFYKNGDVNKCELFFMGLGESHVGVLKSLTCENLKQIKED